MPAFDDMLNLEEGIQHLELELGKARDFVRQCSRRVLEARNALAALEQRIQGIHNGIKALKEAPVALLSEYERLCVALSESLGLAVERRAEIARLERQGRDTQSNIPSLEARLNGLVSELEQFNQVIPFPSR